MELRASEMVPKYTEDLCFSYAISLNILFKNIIAIKIDFDTKSNFQIIDF